MIWFEFDRINLNLQHHRDASITRYSSLSALDSWSRCEYLQRSVMITRVGEGRGEGNMMMWTPRWIMEHNQPFSRVDPIYWFKILRRALTYQNKRKTMLEISMNNTWRGTWYTVGTIPWSGWVFLDIYIEPLGPGRWQSCGLIHFWWGPRIWWKKEEHSHVTGRFEANHVSVRNKTCFAPVHAVRMVFIFSLYPPTFQIVDKVPKLSPSRTKWPPVYLREIRSWPKFFFVSDWLLCYAVLNGLDFQMSSKPSEGRLIECVDVQP